MTVAWQKTSLLNKMGKGRRRSIPRTSTAIPMRPMTLGCRMVEWLSEEAIQIAEKRREVKGKGERELYTQLNAEFKRIARKDKKAFLCD